jgi:predicted  nucleic acid-binding Zn-ribbon protein
MPALLLILTILSLFTIHLFFSAQEYSRPTTLLKAQITALQTALQTEREDGLDLSQQIKHKCAELVAFTSQVSALREAVDTLKNNHEVLKIENELLVQTVAVQNKELENKDGEISEAENKLAALHTIREQETEAWQSNISGTIRGFQSRIEELNTTILTFRDNYRKLEYNHDVLNERNKALMKANKEVEGMNGELRGRNEELKEKNEELEEKNEELSEMVREMMGVLDTVGESLEEEEWVGVEDLVDEAVAESS